MDYSALTFGLINAAKELNQRTAFISSATTSPIVIVDVQGNVGIGTTTPNHTLTVAGDVGAIAFVNTSTRSVKTDVNYVDASTTEMMLERLKSLRVATYRYTIEDEHNPLRLGFIAEDAQTLAPEILSPDGKGVDLYKLATFTLSGVQALAGQVDAHETRIASLEERVAMLESGAISSASGSSMSFASTTAELTSWFASAGNGIGDLFAKTFRASEKICVDDQCLTKDDVQSLLSLVRSQSTALGGSTSTTPSTGITITDASSTPAIGTATTTPTTDTASTTAPVMDAPTTNTSAATTTDATVITITDVPPPVDTSTATTVDMGATNTVTVL
jgi:hypothetical protein